MAKKQEQTGVEQEQEEPTVKLSRFLPPKPFLRATGEEINCNQYTLGAEGVEAIELGAINGVACVTIRGTGCDLHFGAFGALREDHARRES